MLHGLLVAGAIGLIAVAPCLVCLLIISADEVFERVWRWLRRAAKPVGAARAVEVAEPVGPPIEQVAGDLRRLNRLRTGVATRSPVWFNAVQRAYDEGLRVGCAQLGIEQYLDELSGVDLAVERLRVEGELQRAGLALRDAGAQQR